ncbi:type IV secretory system conjugative DNA transfer family protein [Gracilibacillus sp. YIM 98692]|uniref:type IV secretory system conjugative DNA transfer family protein n=1 Tax=Gracilibacillus sp. YIM 98692 TaxID=2663532 RepID=UPI0013D34DCD|nr:type IV secretory system conjugative DNA transfer family protein [Gracilibacillus sp. YIM 98692]
MSKKTIRHYAPMVIASGLLLLSLWLAIRAIANYLFLMIGQFLDYIPTFLLFGNPLRPTIWGMILTTMVLISAWLFSTKLKTFQFIGWRIYIFFQTFLGILFYYAWFSTAPIYNIVIPYIMERIAQVNAENVWQQVLIGKPENLLTFFMFFPSIILALVCIWLSGQYSKYSEDIIERFKEFEFVSHRLQSFIDQSNEKHWPDVALGPNSKSKELVTQPGKDRTLNNIIVGSIGTGKTAALVLPILNQDLHWMTKFINDFPHLYNREDYHTEDVKGMYLNGISVIEPSNDLCQKTYKLVQAHNIPTKSVFYIDPTNPNTPNINPMQGPVDQVAEAFAMVIDGLAEGGDGGNFFFQQSERNHLKHYIYLLKLHDPNKEVTFDMLLDMYNNAQLVRDMHVQLKATFPDHIDDIEDRDERNHWKIVQQINEWFDLNLRPKLNRQGQPEIVTEGNYRGQPAYFDAKAEYVQGLRNILNDIGANKLLRRVLFGKSDFNFDKHLEYGGCLLVNTAKGEMGNLSNVLGKIVLLSLQNAVFRREPAVSNFHHILVDEFPDYIYRPFKEFPAQSRKYKAIVTVVSQTVTQLADKYGETYMHTLLGTLRHKMVYGDIPEFDARLFSGIFGDEKRYIESQNEQSVSPLQEQPMLRSGSMYTPEKEVVLSPNDIIYQKEFQAAVKIVQNNRPIAAVQIDANFVPREEFEKAVVQIEENAAEVWWKQREEYVDSATILPEGAEIEKEEENTEKPSSESSKEEGDIDSMSATDQPTAPNNIQKQGQDRIRKRDSNIVFPSPSAGSHSAHTKPSLQSPKEEVSSSRYRTEKGKVATATHDDHQERVTTTATPHVKDSKPLMPSSNDEKESTSNKSDISQAAIDEEKNAKDVGNEALSAVLGTNVTDTAKEVPDHEDSNQPEISQLGPSQQQLVNELESNFQQPKSRHHSQHHKHKNLQNRLENQRKHFNQF